MQSLQSISLCSITQSKEQYFCGDELCFTQENKRPSCYECLSKLHYQNNLGNHIEKFITINDLEKVIQSKIQEEQNSILSIQIKIQQLQKQSKIDLQESQPMSSISKYLINEKSNYLEHYIQLLDNELQSRKLWFEQILQEGNQNDYSQLIIYYHQNLTQILANYQQWYDKMIDSFYQQIDTLNGLNLEDIQNSLSSQLSQQQTLQQIKKKKKTICSINNKVVDLKLKITSKRKSLWKKFFSLIVTIIKSYIVVYLISYFFQQPNYQYK